MPPEARVCIIDDSEMARTASSMLLEALGNHITVATAATKQAALEIIPSFKKLGVQVVLLDGNLTKNDISGSDGRDIAKAIREHYPLDKDPIIKIVGNSSSGYVEGVDINYNPRKQMPENLVSIVTEI